MFVEMSALVQEQVRLHVWGWGGAFGDCLVIIIIWLFIHRVFKETCQPKFHVI